MAQSAELIRSLDASMFPPNLREDQSVVDQQPMADLFEKELPADLLNKPNDMVSRAAFVRAALQAEVKTLDTGIFPNSVDNIRKYLHIKTSSLLLIVKQAKAYLESFPYLTEYLQNKWLYTRDYFAIDGTPHPDRRETVETFAHYQARRQASERRLKYGDEEMAATLGFATPGGVSSVIESTGKNPYNRGGRIISSEAVDINTTLRRRK